MYGRLFAAGFIAIATGCASVRTVQDGALYRSGQLSATHLERTVKENGIRTVINLRGPDPDRRWYQEQQEVCQRQGVRQVDIALAGSQPNAQEVDALVNEYRQAEKPILIHSRSANGSVALASGLYRTAVLGETYDVARRELPPWVSYRWPVASLSTPDRILRDFQSPQGALAQESSSPQDRLPQVQFERGSSSLAAGRGAPSWGSSEVELPPPDREYFDPRAGGPPRAEIRTDRNIRPVVALGKPQAIANDAILSR
jgi:protein tyrosine phosphatase (PTP) superfamily phosphohydrolase (DUF442 family)